MGPEAVLLEDPADAARVEALIDRLASADAWPARAEAASSLRLAIMDAPTVDVDVLARLVPVLDDVDGASDRDGDPNFERVATRTDAAFAVARVARAAPEAVVSVLPDLLAIAGDPTFRDPGTEYKARLAEAVDVAGRARPDEVTATVLDCLDADDEATRARTLWTLAHLVRRWTDGGHPVLDRSRLREAVDDLAEADAEAVREAAGEAAAFREFGPE